MQLIQYSPFLLQAALVAAQQVYVPTSGTVQPTGYQSSGISNASMPSYHFTPFSFTLTKTTRTATPVPTQSARTYGPAYTEASTLLSSFSTTSWGNYRPSANATASDNSPYGQAAFSSLWAKANIPNITLGLFSTTVSPTPVPTSELILPPPLYFGPPPAGSRSFRQDFVLGVSGASAQIEGAITEEGRTPAVVDFLAGLAAIVAPGADSDKDYSAIENYYYYRQDIERLAAIGMKHYSFSISWSRVLPFAMPGTPVNSQAIDHYNNLIDFILEKGMVPIVTLTHFDTPAAFIGGTMEGLLQRSYLGQVNFGYQNETFVDAFVNYGKLVMAHFADHVPYWFTFNEPQAGVNSGPSIDHVIKSHAELYHFYHNELKGIGKISLKMGTSPAVPLVPTNQSHIDAAMHYTDLYIGAFLYPLALGMDYPDAYKTTIQDYVPLTPEDIEYINGTIDFIAADIYTAAIVYPIVTDYAACGADNSTSNPSYPSCVGSTETTANGWRIGYHSEYMSYMSAPYLRTQLSYYYNTYFLPVMITEFGFSMPPIEPESLEDERFDVQRAEFYLAFFNEILHSIWDDGVEVLGAIMWSYADNWEWGTFSHHFGLQYVNKTSMERSYRRSIFDVVDYVESRRR